ncbi:zinc finger protein 436 isoform X1 [Spodoptera frugiperda]|uniref:Zinc finger protein 436 isoform X1 n=1 Tax=Spodoptera frugiperda TaxID=7108 RepID=A0A9R0D4I1_SPOFR|nr:zinc finger protein 436 isoform X1 [Spodoptera frugiperda]
MASFNNHRTEIKQEELCRTCLSKDNQLLSLFDELTGTTTTLDYIVTTTTGLKISRNDGLPSTICLECKEKATIAFDFKKKSEESNLSLRGFIKKEKKETYTVTKKTNHTDMSGVKTEDLSHDLHEVDDFDDNNFNTLDSGPDLCELDTVKTEIEVPDLKLRFVCKSCLADFDSLDKLKDHEKICIKVECDETNRTYCPLCGTCYNGAGNLTKHMWESHADLMGPKKRGRPKKVLTSTILNKLSENGFCITSMPAKKIECAFCKEHFETKEELGSHVISHKDTKVLRCGLCKKTYLNKENFDLHVCVDEKEDSENESNKGEQNEIKEKVPLEMTLRQILEPNVDVENFNLLLVCSACNCILQSEADLINHRDAEHPELSHRCNLCTKVFATLRSAARHRSICKQIERKHKCTTCGLKFAYQISLNKHILRYHEGQSVSVKFIDSKTKRDESQYQCDTCKRSFTKRELLVKHTKIHMPIENYFECDVCEKKFHRRDNLRSHKRVHDLHRDKKSTNNCLCLYCGRSFSNSSNLIVHMRRHTGEKPYKCDFCGKGFPRSSDLQCHRRSHTGEKPCVCRVCGKGFSRSNKLSRHMRVHTGQRPYKCTYCEKAFSQSNDLNLHIRRHTGDRPYICEVCGDRFIQGTALQNHRRAHGHFPAPPAETPSNVQSLAYTVQAINPNTQ